MKKFFLAKAKFIDIYNKKRRINKEAKPKYFLSYEQIKAYEGKK